MYTVIVTITAGNPIVIGNDYTAADAAMFRDRWVADGYEATVMPTGPEHHDPAV